MKKNSIKLILGMVMILMFLCTNITAFAYSDSCTVGPIAAGTSAPGYLTLNPYVGLGKNLNVSITDGLYDMDYSSDFYNLHFFYKDIIKNCNIFTKKDSN